MTAVTVFFFFYCTTYSKSFPSLALRWKNEMTSSGKRGRNWVGSWEGVIGRWWAGGKEQNEPSGVAMRCEGQRGGVSGGSLDRRGSGEQCGVVMKCWVGGVGFSLPGARSPGTAGRWAWSRCPGCWGSGRCAGWTCGRRTATPSPAAPGSPPGSCRRDRWAVAPETPPGGGPEKKPSAITINALLLPHRGAGAYDHSTCCCTLKHDDGRRNCSGCFSFLQWNQQMAPSPPSFSLPEKRNPRHFFPSHYFY